MGEGGRYEHGENSQFAATGLAKRGAYIAGARVKATATRRAWWLTPAISYKKTATIWSLRHTGAPSRPISTSASAFTPFSLGADDAGDVILRYDFATCRCALDHALMWSDPYSPRGGRTQV